MDQDNDVGLTTKLTEAQAGATSDLRADHAGNTQEANSSNGDKSKRIERTKYDLSVGSKVKVGENTLELVEKLAETSFSVIYTVKHNNELCVAKFNFAIVEDETTDVQCLITEEVMKIDSPYLAKPIFWGLYEHKTKKKSDPAPQVHKFLCTVTKFYKNRDLEYQYKERKNPLVSEPSFLKKTFIPQALEAIEQLHKRSIIHKDIKPSNFFLSDDGKSVLLADFGSALFISGGAEALQLSQHNEVSLPYMPPEAYMCSAATFSTDIYSFGITLQELAMREPWYQFDASLTREDRENKFKNDIQNRVPLARMPRGIDNIIYEIVSLTTVISYTSRLTIRDIRSVLDQTFYSNAINITMSQSANDRNAVLCRTTRDLYNYITDVSHPENWTYFTELFKTYITRPSARGGVIARLCDNSFIATEVSKIIDEVQELDATKVIFDKYDYATFRLITHFNDSLKIDFKTWHFEGDLKELADVYAQGVLDDASSDLQQFLASDLVSYWMDKQILLLGETNDAKTLKTIDQEIERIIAAVPYLKTRFALISRVLDPMIPLTIPTRKNISYPDFLEEIAALDPELDQVNIDFVFIFIYHGGLLTYANNNKLAHTDRIANCTKYFRDNANKIETYGKRADSLYFFLYDNPAIKINNVVMININDLYDALKSKKVPLDEFSGITKVDAYRYWIARQELEKK